MIELTKDEARSIVVAAGVCYGEGLQGPSDSLLLKIAKKWPDIVEDHISWCPGFK